MKKRTYTYLLQLLLGAGVPYPEADAIATEQAE
jgi:hypothetical protein